MGNGLLQDKSERKEEVCGGDELGGGVREGVVVGDWLDNEILLFGVRLYGKSEL